MADSPDQQPTPPRPPQDHATARKTRDFLYGQLRLAQFTLKRCVRERKAGVTAETEARAVVHALERRLDWEIANCPDAFIDEDEGHDGGSDESGDWEREGEDWRDEP